MWANIRISNIGGVMLFLALFVLATQRAAAKPNAHKNHGRPSRVVSIRFGHWGGLGEGHASELQISDGQATLTETSQPEIQRRYPNLRVSADLSKRDWQELQALVDRDAMFSLPDRTSCAACVDGVDEFVEVKFSDHTRKSVTYAEGSPPKQLQDLVAKLKALEMKLQNELPPNWHAPR